VLTKRGDDMAKDKDKEVTPEVTPEATKPFKTEVSDAPAVPDADAPLPMSEKTKAEQAAGVEALKAVPKPEPAPEEKKE
jgi:hypothetical protein